MSAMVTPAGETSEPAAGAVDDRWVVVIADDDEAARLLVERFLGKLGLTNRVVHAADGDAAMAVLADTSLRPVLLLLDVHMPKRSGIEVLTWVRDHQRLSDLPVVVLTASAELDEVQGAYDLGISSYLVKPVGFAALLDVLRQTSMPWAILPPRGR